MKISVIIPHFRSGKATSHAIYKLLEYKGIHDLQIIIIDNSPKGDESWRYVFPFSGVEYIWYNENRLSSHGVAYDYAIENMVSNEVVVTIESDSFPTSRDFFDNVSKLVEDGYDSALSYLQLSGGFYGHPCGGFYKKSVWEEVKALCDKAMYTYFPNMSHTPEFDYHLMVRNDILDKVLDAPDDWIELADSYKGLGKSEILDKAKFYSTIAQPFHNGMGNVNESLATYGQRNVESEVPQIMLDNKRGLIRRIGYEPGQAMFYMMLAMGKKIFKQPTETKWLPNKENQQQEYTRMDNGFTHIWAGSSFLDMKDTPMHDVYEFKKNQIDELYNSLPKHLKI